MIAADNQVTTRILFDKVYRIMCVWGHGDNSHLYPRRYAEHTATSHNSSIGSVQKRFSATKHIVIKILLGHLRIFQLYINEPCLRISYNIYWSFSCKGILMALFLI